EHAAWADPDGRRVKNDAACIHVYPVAKREVAAVGDVEGSLDEDPLAHGAQDSREFRRTGTTLCRVHGGVTPTSLPCNIAERFELWRGAGIPPSVGHFGQRCGRRMDGCHVRHQVTEEASTSVKLLLERL